MDPTTDAVIESLSPNDVISCLWNKNAVEKCRIGLCDIVVYENGNPSRWYVTGKTGEVTKKRAVEIETITQRWSRISAQSGSNYVAIIRQKDYILKLLTPAAWQSLLEGGLADSSIISLHCYVRGNNHTYYRNSFRLRDKLGRFATHTHSFTIKGDGGDVGLVHLNDCTFTEIKAASIRNIMDLATNTVVRYLEAMLSIKILSIEIDYVIDAHSQLWLMWSSDAKFVRGNLANLNIPGFFDPDKAGRMSWAGLKFAESFSEAYKDGRLGSTQSPTRLQSSQEKYVPEKADVFETSAQITLTNSTVDEEQARKSRRKKGGQRQGDFLVTASENPELDAVANTQKFPDPFRCKGDYCKIHLQAAGSLYSDKNNETHLAGKFFTKHEVDLLKKDSRFSKMFEFGADGPALAAISQKSIILARQERRGLDGGGPKAEAWEAYPLTPRQKSAGNLRHKLAAIDSSYTNGGNGELLEPENSAVTESKQAEGLNNLLAADKEHRETFSKTMASYYDQVRVCGVCFNIYSMFDWARSVIGKSDAHTALLEAKGAGLDNEFNPKRTEEPKMYLSSSASVPSLKTESLKDGSLSTKSVDLSPGKRGTSQETKRAKEKTWKDYKSENPRTVKMESSTLKHLETYLTAGADALEERKAKEKEDYINKRITELVPPLANATTGEKPNFYRGRILLACDDNEHGRQAKQILEEAYFHVTWVKEGKQALNEFSTDTDCVLVEKDLPLLDGLAIVKSVRDFEKTERRNAAALAAAQGKGVQPFTRRHPVICFTKDTSPEDIKIYMKADMDGCVSYPVNKVSLLNTIRAAVPQHLAIIEPPEDKLDPDAPQAFKLGTFGEKIGSMDSSTVAAKTMVTSAVVNEDISLNGIVQLDADTRVVYSVLDASRNSKLVVSKNKPFFNLVVCHDLFDTLERFKIFMRSIVNRYVGMQVLLWNYPGQAFTEFRKEQCVNNEYCSTCLNEVLGQLGERGTKDFDTTRPFYILGYGFGASVAAFYAAHYRVPNLRGIINVNGWSFVDSYLAGVLHDCINIFENAPASRPDLPVYFFSRFLFSRDYLAKVSVPLALNIYTAVHNPISKLGRITICKGILNNVDCRPTLKEIDVPIICIQSTQDSFCRPNQVEPFASYRGGEVRSIFKALEEPSKTCIVWMKSGHEVFQECRKQTQLLVEQILTGFHDNHDVTFPSAPVVDRTAAEQGLLISNLPWESDKSLNNTVEDKFIDSVLSKINNVSSSLSVSSQGTRNRSVSPNRASSVSPSKSTRSRRTGGDGSVFNPTMSLDASSLDSNPGIWEDFSSKVSNSTILGVKKTDTKKKKKQEETVNVVVDPTSTAFERQDSSVYGKKPNIHEYPEVKEYMNWRLKRNKKRLQRLQGAAKTIQSAFRAYLARHFVRNIRRKKAAVIIQRAFRGWKGRCNFLEQGRRVWATLVIQRSWRGYLSRKWYLELRRRIAAAVNIQRVFRGHKKRQYVQMVRRIRYHAASVIQAMCRRYHARKEAFRRRFQRNASVVIQRIYRGHLGRRRAITERDKYIFSKSQAQGIEFGRQMLLEHKLHATKLQSDVTLLTQEKVGAEEQVEALLEEISGFEEGVRTLEKEMHQLSKVEAEAAAFMDEESKFELREQKIKLDKEFGAMLTKISNRKEMLLDLEKKLAAIDKNRQNKEEELRTLERKLVVLLEEQQNELNAIKRKQDVRGAMLVASHNNLMQAANGIPGSQTQALTLSNAGMQSGSTVGGGGGGGGGGPSLQEKKQAAQLMQSTETLMKFGFMSMSMTYFSSLNMIKALRTVSAQDTVMAALADVHSQRAIGATNDSASKQQFIPDLKPGQLSGQEALRVSAWSVQDVAKWLQTISLGQYAECFIDAAIDGEFLYDLVDDDLKNTLGIEHRLHRKKILNCVHRLKVAEAQRDDRINKILLGTGGLAAPEIGPEENLPPTFPDNPFQPADGSDGSVLQNRSMMDGPKVKLTELFSFVRHSKVSLLKEALDYLPNKKFDKSLVKSPFVVAHGTVYVEGYERLPFHINKVDEFGNTMLSLACQNGNVKICKYLIAKGANPNHQNKTGQSPAHFAISYKFFELSQWLFENGASDTVENKFGLTPYDGLAPEGDVDE